MTHEATFQASSPSTSESTATVQGGDSKPSSHAPSHGQSGGANDAFLLTLRPLQSLYDSPTSPAWGCRK